MSRVSSVAEVFVKRRAFRARWQLVDGLSITTGPPMSQPDDRGRGALLAALSQSIHGDELWLVPIGTSAGVRGVLCACRARAAPEAMAS